MNAVRSTAITHDSKYIISGEEDKIARVQDFQERRQKFVMQGHFSIIRSIAVTIDYR